MSTSPMAWIDWLIVAIPLVAILYIGFLSEKYIRGVSDFLAAGRKAGRYLLTVSDGTAGMGLISVCAMFEQKYKCGYALDFWGNLAVLVGLAMTLTGFVTYRFRETRALTMAEFFQKRYSHGFRIFAGILAFISGVINYALFPAVGGRFLVYYCGLPFYINILGVPISTYGLVMAVFLGFALFIVLTGGQITTMVTDSCQGLFAYFGYTVITITLLVIFSRAELQEAMMHRPTGESFFNPFNVDKLTSFNLLYIIIGVFGSIYNRNAWLGSQAYQVSAASPHEQKMAGVLGQWRAGFLNIALMLLVLGAYTYMHSTNWAGHGEAVNAELDARTAEDFHLAELHEQEMGLGELKERLAEFEAVTPPQKAASKVVNELYQEANIRYTTATKTADTIRTQMLVPIALRHILPIGVTGIFCALMIFLMVSTDTTYLHSWGTIFIQDVVLPIRNKPIQARTQMNLLRWAIAGIAVFAWFFSYYFQQGDFILQFFAMTGTIFLGGAGACIIGGLYWKKGTTQGAYTAMAIGLFFAVLGFVLNQTWATRIYPWLATSHPQGLESFRLFLEKLGNSLVIVQWETSPEAMAKSFPITSQEVYFIGMLSAMLGYILVSLRTCKKECNLDELLHRGKYNLEHFVSDTADQKVLASAEKKRFNWRSILGITPEYSKGDRILAWSVLIWTVAHFILFIVQAVWNLPEAWRWNELTWFKFWLYFSLPKDLLVAVITTVWFTWGCTRDLKRLFAALKEDAAKKDQSNEDNGQILTK